MSFRRALCWLPLGLLPLGLLAGCGAPQKINPQPGAAPVSAVSVFPRDDLGRKIALKSPARRVIVIGPGAVETVFALGAEKSLVGRDSSADFPSGSQKISIAGDYQGPNVEKSIALRPDLVIVQGETWGKARIEQWQNQIGAPVAALVATDVRGVRNGIEKIGSWLGKSADSLRIAGALQPRASQRAVSTPSAFVEIGRSPLYTAGQKTLVGDVLKAGGFFNLAQVSGYQTYGVESLLARQPDAYIAPLKATRETVLRQLRADAALSRLKCVREGHVVVIDSDLLLRPGPRLEQGIAQLRAQAARLAARNNK